MSEVAISQRAYDAAWDASMGAGNFPMTNALEAAAPIIVAEYLRKLANESAIKWPTGHWGWLHMKADELDPTETGK